jgi:hypothetical protein
MAPRDVTVGRPSANTAPGPGTSQTPELYGINLWFLNQLPSLTSDVEPTKLTKTNT